MKLPASRHATGATTSPMDGSEPAVPGDYAGDLLKEPVDYEDDGYPICATGSGEGRYKYAGLRRHEYNAARVQELLGYTEGADFIIPDPPLTTTVLGQFNETLWAGIDCSGLVQRAINRADNKKIPGAHSDLDDLGDGLQCTVGSKGCEPCGSQGYVPEYAHKIWDKSTPKNRRPVLTKTARKGDVVVYDGHIALVHSEKPACTTTGAGTSNEQTTCTYEIVHASGDATLCYQNQQNELLPDVCSFNRKVVVNEINNRLRSGTLRNPTGFGRIKLWD